MREYIGDGAYISTDGRDVTLTTSNGYRDTNTIVFEPEVLQAFLQQLREWQVNGELKWTPLKLIA